MSRAGGSALVAPFFREEVRPPDENGPETGRSGEKGVQTLMSMPQGQYQATCVRRSIPRKYGIFFLLTVTLMAWVLAVPSHKSYAIKSLIDQAQDQGYTDG